MQSAILLLLVALLAPETCSLPLPPTSQSTQNNEGKGNSISIGNGKITDGNNDLNEMNDLNNLNDSTDLNDSTELDLEADVAVERDARYVFYEDNRTRVACGDETLSPYNAVGSIHFDTNNDFKIDQHDLLLFVCSASLIGPNQILSAAHCLWDKTVPYYANHQFEIYFCMSNCNSSCLDGGYHVTNLWVPQYYKDNLNGISDYGLGQLVDLPNFTTYNMMAGAHPYAANFSCLGDFAWQTTSITIAAHSPLDKPWYEMWQVSTPEIVYYAEHNMFFRSDIVEGYSGAGVLFQPTPNSSYFLIGVVAEETCGDTLHYDGVICEPTDPQLGYMASSFNRAPRIDTERACEICSLVYAQDQYAVCDYYVCNPSNTTTTTSMSTTIMATTTSTTTTTTDAGNHTNYTTTSAILAG